MYVCISLLTQRCPKRICTCFLGPWPSGVRRPWALVRSGGSADQLWRSQGWKGRRRTTTAAATTRRTTTTTTTINQNENQIQNYNKKKKINNNKNKAKNNKQQRQEKEEEQQRQEQEQEQEQQQQQQQQQEQRQPQQRQAQAQAHRQQPQGAAKPLFLGRAPPADGWGRRIYIYIYILLYKIFDTKDFSFSLFAMFFSSFAL